MIRRFLKVKSLTIPILVSLIVLVLVFNISTTLGEDPFSAQVENNLNYSNTRATDPARLEISKSVSNKQIFVETANNKPNQTRVTLTVKGVGYPGVEYDPQDTVFIMDNSDSMDEHDNEFKRVEALKLYLNSMLPPDDRAAVVKFSSAAELVGGVHLTSNYTEISDSLSSLWHTSGLTNLGAAMALANNEILQYGDVQNKTLIEILLTDGQPEPPENNVTLATINEAVDNNIKIYTVGLGDDHDANLLRWISAKTGGKYYFAKEASDLIEIYDEISNQFHNFTAGSDPNVLDSEPMVRDVLPNYINYVPNTFSRKPDHIGNYFGSFTKLDWNISHIAIGETWTVSYNISTREQGEEVAISAPLARVKYTTQKGVEQTLWFDEIVIRVLPGFSQYYPSPPPPLPPATPPVPPTAGFPVPVPTPATPVPISYPGFVPAAATPTPLPMQYLIGGFVGLGIAERVKHYRLIKSRQKVAVGI
jgi:hypothetical protein